MIKKTILNFLFIILANVYMFAQNVIINPGDMPSSVVACGDPSTFSVNVFGPISSGTVVSTTLPTGIKFNSLITSGVTATATANGVNFTIGSALATASDKLTIQYTVTTPCTPLPANPNVVYTMGSITKSVAFPTVAASLLEVTTITPTAATVNIFASQTYQVTVKQSANTYSNNVKLNITHSTNVGISTAVGVLTPGVVSGTTQVDVLELSGSDIATLTGGNTKFELNETVTIPVQATLKGCTTGETIRFQAAYGCGTTTACTTGNISNVGLNATAVQNSSLSMDMTKQPWPGFQTSNADNAIFKLKNTGAGPAYAVKIQFGFNTNVSGAIVRDYFDFFDFKVSNTPVAENPTKKDYIEFLFTSDPDGPGVGFDDLDGDGFYNDLPAGASTDITALLRQTIDNTPVCLANKWYNTAAGSSAVDQVGWVFTYKKNACNTAVTENGTYSSTYPTNSPFTIGVPSPTSDITATNDNVNFVAGSKFVLNYSFSNLTSVNTLKTVDGSQAFWKVAMQLPAGVIPDPALSATFTNNNYSVTTNGMDVATNTYYYDVKPLAGANGALTANGKLSFPVVVDASCNVNGVFNANFSVGVYQNPATVFISKLGCTTTPNFSLGCGAAVGLNIDNFDLKRQTFGMKQTAQTVQATEADLTPIDLNHYLNGDKAVAAYSMTLVDPNISAAKIRFEYDAYDWFKIMNGKSGITGITGSYTNPTTNVTTPFSISGAALANYYTYTDAFSDNGKSGYVFDVMKLFQTGGPLAGVALVANAKINFNANLLVNQDLHATNSTGGQATNTINGYNVTGINTYTTITKTDNTQVVGNNKADKAIVFTYYVKEQHSLNNPISIVQCNQNDLTFTIAYSANSVFGDLFTNELRRNAKIDQFSLLIPIGLTYVPGTATVRASGSSTISISDPTLAYGFNADGTPNPAGLYNKLSFVNPGNWPQVDATTTFDIHSINIKFMPNLFINTYTSAIGNFRMYATPLTGNFSLNFDTPRNLTPSTTASAIVAGRNISMYNYSVSSAGANVTTASNTASWPITIANNNANSNAIPNMWIAVKVPNGNLTPTLWDGATQIPIVAYTDPADTNGTTTNYWAKVGNIPAGSKTFTLRTNNFTICGTDSFRILTSYDCLEYPTDPAHGYALQGNRTPITTQNLTMSLTTQTPALTVDSSVNTNGTTRFDICTPIDETLTVTNGANGYAYKIEPNMTFPQGMTFTPGSFKVNYNGVDYTISDPVLVSGSTYKVDVFSNSNVPFVSTGLPGTSNSVDPKAFILKYKVQTICYASGVGNYISGSRIDYSVHYQSGCQSTMPNINLQSQSINIGDSNSNQNYVNTLKTLESLTTVGNHQINDAKELNVKIINQGDTSGNLETIKVFLDGNYDYVANSTIIQAGNTFSGMTATNPTSTIDVTGKRVLVWGIPSGMASGQVIEFNFKVYVANPTAFVCSASTPATLNTFIGATIVCALNGESCNLEYPTGVEQKVTLNAFKPSITANVVSATTNATAGTVNYSIVYNITNTNANYDVKAGLSLKLYNDLNNNGILDSGEPLLDNTQITTVNIAPNATTSNQTLTSSYSGNGAEHLLFVIDSNPTVSDVCTPVVLKVATYCYKPGITTGNALDTKHGITSLGRAGANDSDNWPMVRKGAWTVLESQTKGFVINRLTDAQVAAIPAANLVEGMTVYNITQNCLMINTTGTASGWKCFNNKACPDNP